MSSRFAEVTTGPPIEVFALNKAFLDDTNPNKVNLGVGGTN
jgi:aspartate aminotransferase, cytoplasmic